MFLCVPQYSNCSSEDTDMAPQGSKLCPKLNHSCIEERDELLQGAVEKLARFGQRVGVTPEEMISLLDSGVSIQNLLAFVAAKNSGTA
jgi:hypothetical protein